MIKNTLYKTLVLLILSLLGLNTLKAQSTVGKDFWVTFLPNLYPDVDNLSLIATGRNSCTGVVTNPLTGWSSAFNVTPGTITNINIPPSEVYNQTASDTILR